MGRTDQGCRGSLSTARRACGSLLVDQDIHPSVAMRREQAWRQSAEAELRGGHCPAVPIGVRLARAEPATSRSRRPTSARTPRRLSPASERPPDARARRGSALDRFRRSRFYHLEFGGRLYDSKAIAGYAHGVATGISLAPVGFSGGDKTVAERLISLGFEVKYLPNPDWRRDEIILACALVEANGWKQLGRTDPRVAELSELLQTH